MCSWFSLPLQWTNLWASSLSLISFSDFSICNFSASARLWAYVRERRGEEGERKRKESRDEPDWYMLVMHVANSRIGFSLVPRLQYGTGGLTESGNETELEVWTSGLLCSTWCDLSSHCITLLLAWFTRSEVWGKGEDGGLGARQLHCIQHTKEQLKATSSLYRVCQVWQRPTNGPKRYSVSDVFYLQR